MSRYAYIVLVVLAVLIQTGCSVTKYVGEDEHLLDRIEIKGETGHVSTDELSDYVRQQPNYRFLHLWRVGLGVYSLSSKRESNFGLWLRRIGTAPVIYDEKLMHRSSEQLRLYLISKGYYDAEVTDTMYEVAPKRCNVQYRVKSGDLYRISSIAYSVPEGEVGQIIMSDTVHSLLKVGDAFDSNVHDAERARITRLMQEHGYYSFGKDFVYYVADSTREARMLADSIVVVNPLGGADKRTQVPHRKAVVDDVELLIVPTDGTARQMLQDTVRLNIQQVRPGLSVRFQGDNPFADRVMKNSCFIRPGEIYCLSDAELTQRRFNSLKPFRSATFRFMDTDSATTAMYDDSLSHVHCVGFLQTRNSQSVGVDLEGTNSSGNLGAAASIKYSHANIFHGAEAFSIKWRIATQRQSATTGKEEFYTLETGVETSVTLPAMLFPYTTEHFYKHHNPNTMFTASFDYQRRPEFTRTVVASRMAYNWFGSVYAQHTFVPIELNIVSIPNISDNFKNYISGTYLQQSYTDHFIMSLGYSFLFNQQRASRNSAGWYFRFGVETAGNILNALIKGEGEEFKRVCNIRFSQYVRTESEIRYQAVDFLDNNFVVRLFGGVGVPYGNSAMLPFEKRFFAGGANSVRAWPVRGLGPGREVSDRNLRYHNQTSDIRLEGNVEYRFKIFSAIEGAAFADAGNIWALKRSYNSEASQFSRDFYKEIALGAGLGIRLNFNYFIFRVDAAYRLHDPSAEQEWVIRNRFDGSDIAWNFAIGYPF